MSISESGLDCGAGVEWYVCREKHLGASSWQARNTLSSQLFIRWHSQLIFLKMFQTRDWILFKVNALQGGPSSQRLGWDGLDWGCSTILIGSR